MATISALWLVHLKNSRFLPPSLRQLSRRLLVVPESVLWKKIKFGSIGAPLKMIWNGLLLKLQRNLFISGSIIVRKAFSDTLVNVAKEDPKLIFLTGDLGFQVFDDFIAQFPERYINVGVAEAQLINT